VRVRAENGIALWDEWAPWAWRLRAGGAGGRLSGAGMLRLRAALWRASAAPDALAAPYTSARAPSRKQNEGRV